MRWLSIICLTLLLLTTGCDRAQNEFNRVALGMTKAQVVKLLGEPQGKETLPAGELLHWQVGARTIVLQINNDRVTGKQLAGPVRQSQGG